MESYLERLELPDGQWAELLTRLTYQRWQSVLLAVAHDVTNPVFADAVVRAVVWKASLRHALTGEEIGADSLDDAQPEIIDAIFDRAFVLYNAWRKEAFPKADQPTSPPDGTSG